MDLRAGNPPTLETDFKMLVKGKCSQKLLDFSGLAAEQMPTNVKVCQTD